MSLETYRKKRDFSKTPEPKGDARKRKGDSFVIQKHAARRLHYDLRLEMDGTLKSWAVTRGPSLVPGEKRLAVQTEDHPLEYGDFEGTIPKGEYGGGTVIVWDRGSWKPVGDARKGYAKGHLEFELQGEKLGGRWHLVKMARRPREKRDNWLLFKATDKFAREEKDPDIVEERPESVKTGRLIEDVEGEDPGWSSKTGRTGKAEADQPARRAARKPARKAAAKKAEAEAASEPPMKGAKKAALPDFVPPALASLKPSAPAGKRWLHEIKFDGYRLQARIEGGKARLLTRGGLDWTDRFGKEIAKALASLPAKEALIDGEIVVEASGGASDFSALQADLSAGRTDRFIYYAFDLLHLDGFDLRDAALIDRKERLSTLLDGSPSCLRYSEHFEENGDIILRHACRLSLEGVVSKLAEGKYVSGRGKDWIKSKCSERQELVIAGYVVSSTSDKAIGSLVLGYYDKGKLRHAGRVGTGFTTAMAAELFRRLSPIERKTSPFADKLDATARRQVRFVEPELVAEVEFRSWTADGILRHTSFRGLREDKPAEDIVREAGETVEKKARPISSVKLTHPDRIYWKEAGVTKEGLADYYGEVWKWMAPHVANRPLALVRCPQGTTSHCFFQKHAWKGLSPTILQAHDPQDDSDEPILGVDSLDGLIGLVQGATLEIHGWQSTFHDLERPDQIVMDLDPGDGVTWSDIADAAREVRSRLEGAGLAAFVKTSGGKGLHVVAPLKPSAGWEEVKGFAKGIADAMTSDDPDRYVATVTKSKRKGRILVDYLRNGRGATAVAPYSTRAREGAPVSMPVAWEELDSGIGGAHFTVSNAMARLANLAADPWADFEKSRVALSAPKQGRRRRAA